MWPFAVRKSSGYGAYDTPRPEKRNVDAHRHVCTLAHGPAPTPEHEAAHSCSAKLCINKHHLRWADKVENAADAKAAGNLKGGGRGRQRLFAAEVTRIRTGGESLVALGAEYGMAPAYIGKVRRGECHV